MLVLMLMLMLMLTSVLMLVLMLVLQRTGPTLLLLVRWYGSRDEAVLCRGDALRLSSASMPRYLGLVLRLLLLLADG